MNHIQENIEVRWGRPDGMVLVRTEHNAKRSCLFFGARVSGRTSGRPDGFIGGDGQKHIWSKGVRTDQWASGRIRRGRRTETHLEQGRPDGTMGVRTDASNRSSLERRRPDGMVLVRTDASDRRYYVWFCISLNHPLIHASISSIG